MVGFGIVLSLLALIIAVSPYIGKALLYRFYQPLEITLSNDVRDGDEIIWPRNEVESEEVANDGEWDLFNFSLKKTGKATPYIERILFGSSIPLEPRDFNEKRGEVTRPKQAYDIDDGYFMYEYQSLGLREESYELDPNLMTYLPFKRPNEDIDLKIRIEYKIPLSDFGFRWSDSYVKLKPLIKNLHIKISEYES